MDFINQNDMATIKKKAQKGTTVKATADSTRYYEKRMMSNMNMADRTSGDYKDAFTKNWKQDAKDLERQSKKGKLGYDANGFPFPKKPNKVYKSGGKITPCAGCGKSIKKKK